MLTKFFYKKNLLNPLFFVALVLYLLFVTQTVRAQTVDTLWSENWEGSWLNDWHITYGTWEVGIPTSGPGSAFSSVTSAATTLNGNYGDYVDSTRLIRHTTFVVPSANANPRLRFWHWYSFRINDNDYGKVQIRISGNTQWEDITAGYFHNWTGGIWTNTYLDLSDYSGLTVEIAFYFHSDDYYTAPGWYIDDVAVIYGDTLFSDPEDWETGFDDWYVDYGVWEVGSPTSGPGSAYQGQNCVGTILSGNYGDYLNSRLISPFIHIPPIDSIPRLRFEHWYSFRINDNDYGKVQVRTLNNNWTDLPKGTFNNWTGGIWTNPYIDLSEYADSTVQFAFQFHSDDYYTSSGWYMDDLTVETGELVFNNPEDWESGFDDWHVDYGVWEVGSPTSGPGSAYEGQNCAGTILDGNYGDYLDSRLISPPIKIPSAINNPRLRFENWYSFRINDNDYGDVEIKVVGSSDWQVIEHYTDASSDWFTPYLTLSDYADSTVQIAFHFHSDDYYTSSGWYIDSVRIEPIIPTSIVDHSFHSPGKFALLQNYPNPFNPSTKIRFGLPYASNVKLEVYNLLGQKVAVVLDQWRSAGFHIVEFDGSSLSSGIYIYRIQAFNSSGGGENFHQVKKMILLK